MSAVLSWLSAGLVLILVLLYPARKLVQRRKPAPGSPLAFIYKFLRKTHLAVGVLIIPVVYVHCRLAARESGVRSMLGVILMVLLILLAATYFFRKPLGKHWKRLHQLLAAILIIITMYHSFIEFILL